MVKTHYLKPYGPSFVARVLHEPDGAFHRAFKEICHRPQWIGQLVAVSDVPDFESFVVPILDQSISSYIVRDEDGERVYKSATKTVGRKYPHIEHIFLSNDN